MKKHLTILLITFISLSFGSYADEKLDADATAKKLANPNNVMASLELKTQYRAFAGDRPGADSKENLTFVFQPKMPIPLDNGDSILFRPAIPFIVDQPIPFGATGYIQESGLGDITFDLAYAPKSEDGILVAYGIISSLPTGDEDLGMGESTTLGPEYLIGKITPTYVIGAFPNHQWDIAGDRKVNITSSQFFGILLPGGGWSYGTSPTVSYNWESEQWTVPVQVTASKTVIWGGRPWKFGMEVNYYVEKDDYFAPEWMIGISITPVVENKLLAWFKS